MRYSLPKDLRDYIDALDTKEDLRRHLHILRDESELHGFPATVEAMRETLCLYGHISEGCVGVLAASIAEGREPVVYEEEVDLSVYDQAFSCAGGIGDGDE